jgi:flagellar hook-associated protein 1 FlgK
VPVSSFYGLQTSLRGLLAQQRALDVTGHNIANASTAGFSRQEAVMAASAALEIPSGATADGAGAHLGSGVDIQSYRRVRDTFLDLQYRAQATRLGEQAGKAEGLDRAELALSEPGDNGINAKLAEFWSAWSELGNAADEPAARSNLVEQARSLADAFATVDRHLETVRTQAQGEYDALTATGGEIHGIAKEIADLNATIKKFVTAGDEPNDLMDRRDVLLDQLSKLGQVSVTDLGTGSVNVKFGGASDPDLVADTAVSWPPALSAPSGRLGALRDLASASGPLQTYRDELDAVAANLVSSVNALHTAAGVPPFFGATAGSEAATLGVLVTPSTVRASGSTAPSAGDLALRVAELANGAPDQAYRAFVSTVGAEVRESARQEANAQVLVDSVEDRRQSISGVALDEEMSNLIRFQRSYQASSRAMSTMDEMLDVLINRTGRVGL